MINLGILNRYTCHLLKEAADECFPRIGYLKWSVIAYVLTCFLGSMVSRGQSILTSLIEVGL